ncbi:MAG: TetR family transcriptional regulator [Alphaproteobacteria bacterium HGW-Alphaproteobacteria-1]|jgi:TetR/AcrR family transcriptional repressor of nem operon|nr:MAG: TetR family transcriptional regulator [Alphaproteobacteria bacterium HGW-Alphaproteobacteria-1]
MGRPRSFNPDKVVDNAIAAFWARGFEATSINDLVAATGVNRASLYAGFEDKRGLFLASLSRYDDRQRRGFLERLARDLPPRDAILAAFDAAATPPAAGQPGGCLLVNTALELAPHDAEINDLVTAAFEGVETFFCDRIEAAQATGTIRADIDAAHTAQTLLGLFVGLRVLMRAGAAPDAAPAAITSQARALLM